MNRMLTTVLLAGACLTGAGAEADIAISERQAADADGQVQVSNIAGEVTVTGWDEDEVEVTGTLGDGVERLDLERDGSLTMIKVVYPNDGRNTEGSRLRIRVPKASELEVTAVSAPIEVAGVEGRQRLRTVSGDVATDVFLEDVEAETVSGDVSAMGRDAASHTSLTTVSGSIETRGVSGELDATTVSGRIDVEARMLSRARLNTTNGPITLDGGLEPDGRLDLSTTNGRVELMLDHDRDLDVDAQTFNGATDNCFGREATKNRFSPERTLRFQAGEANRSVRIRSMNGRIDLCSREQAR